MSRPLRHGAEDVEVEDIVEKEGNAKGEGFMSSLAFITVKAKVKGEDKTYEWVVKSTPREANRYSPASSSLFQPSVTNQGKLVGEHGK